MAKRKKQQYQEEELTGAAPQPSILGKTVQAGLSGLSSVGNLLDVPGSMVRDTIAGQNPFDQLLTPFRDTNRVTGRDLNRAGGLAGSKDTYGNWWGGLGTEIATDPLTYLTLGGGAVAKGVGRLMGKTGIHGLEAARIATAAAKAGKLSGVGTDAYKAGKGVSKYWDWVGPREARLTLTPSHVKEFAPEMFKMLETTSKANKFDLMNNMNEPMGALAKIWPLGDAGLIGKGKTAQRIARGLDVAGDAVRHTRIPGTAIRPVGDLANLVNAKAAKATNPGDLQAAYHAHHVKEGARYEANLMTAKWTNDLRRMGHKDTDVSAVRNWIEFPSQAPAEAQPLVAEMRQYVDRIPAMAREMGVNIGDVTPNVRAAGGKYDYWMRHLAEGVTSGQSFGKMFDPSAMAEHARSPWTLGSRGGTKALMEMAQNPMTERLAAKGKEKLLSRWIERRYGLKFDATGKELASGVDPITGKSIISNLPATFLDKDQMAKMRELGHEPTTENALKLAAGLKGSNPVDVYKFRESLKASGNLNSREAAGITGIWKAWAEGYRGQGLGETLRDVLKGGTSGSGVKSGITPPRSALTQETAPAFYSKLAQVAAQKVSGNTVSKEQFLGMLRNPQHGVKEEEIADMGIEALFAGKKSLTKQELMDYLEENAVELKDVVKGGPRGAQKFGPEEALRLRDDHQNAANELAELAQRHGTTAASVEARMGRGEQVPDVLRNAFQTYRDTENAYRDSIGFRPVGDATKYGDYKTPGGENYRELLMQVPRTLNAVEGIGDEVFKHSHWDEPNVLAHIRFQDHTDTAGKKVLLIDEIQSDWHQAGRKAGYQTGEASEDAIREYVRKRYSDTAGMDVGEETVSNLLGDPEVRSRLVADMQKNKVPDAPFKKSWHTLAMKRMIRYAAENGYDRVAWTKGADHFERWGSPGIAWRKGGSGGWLVNAAEQVGGQGPDGRTIEDAARAAGILKEPGSVAVRTKEQLREIVEQIRRDEPEGWADKITNRVWDRMQLEDTGVSMPRKEGFEEFYDSKSGKGGLLLETNRIIKKYGARVGETNITTKRQQEQWGTINEAGVRHNPVKEVVENRNFHAFDITPSMRDEVMNKGQALYQRGPHPSGMRQAIKGAVDFGADGKAILYTFKHSDVSTHVHELAHIMRRHLTADDQKIADTFVGAAGQWTRDQEEKFAAGFENYLRTGQAPNEVVKPLFERLKKWMTGIYQSIVGTNIDVQLTPEIQELYGRLIGGVPKGGNALANKIAPQNTFQAAAKSLIGMTPDVRKAGIYANHPINDFSASVSGTLDKIESSRVALERMVDAAVPAGPDTVPISQVLKGIDLDAGDGTYGAAKWLTDHGGDVNAHIPAETAKFLTQMHEGFKGGPPAVHAMGKLYDNVSKFMQVVFTNLDPVRFNVRNVASGQFANMTQPEQFSLKSIADANNLIRGGVIKGASQNPFIAEEAAKRGIQGLDDKRATEILAEMVYAREATGSYGVSMHPHQGQQGVIGGKLQDVIHGIPGGEPFRWGTAAKKLAGGYGGQGTSWNPRKMSIRGIFGAEKSTLPLAAFGEDVSHWSESMNRIAPMWALMQAGVHPNEAIERVLKAQVGYQGRFYTKTEQQILKRVFLFYSFAKGQFPFTLQQLIENPGGRLAQSLRAINRGKSDDELVPQHVAETASIPIGNMPGMAPLEKGAKRYITGLGLGFEDPAQFAVPSFQNAGLEAMSRMNPLIKGPLEAVTGQSFFQRAPGGGGRSLEDLDPPLGRIMANVSQMAGMRDESNKAPVRFPGSQTIEHMLANSPLSNIITKTRTATDTRKGLAGKAVNLLTGVKVTDVSPSAQDRELRNRIGQIEKEMGGRIYTDTFLPKDAQKSMSPEELAAYKQLQALRKLLQERSKARQKGGAKTGGT